MARSVLTHRVFISAPSDVANDIEVVRQCLEEINAFLQLRGVRFEPFHWVTDVTPGVSPRAQDRINEQVDEYDLIIGVLGSRMGTPTGDSASGTAEEIQTARRSVDSLRFGNDSIIVMFRNVSLDMAGSDLEQAAKVQHFKKELGESGILYGQYSDDLGLRISLFRALGRIVASIPSGSQMSSARDDGGVFNEADEKREVTPQANEGELGIFDYQQVGMDAMSRCVAHMRHINDSMEEFSEYTNEVAPQLGVASRGGNIPHSRKILTEYADRMSLVAELIADESARMKDDFDSAVQAFEGVLDIQLSDFTNADVQDDLAELRTTVAELNAVMTKNVSGAGNLALSLSRLPRLTKEFNKGKRDLVDSIQSYSNNIGEIGFRGSEFERLVGGALSRVSGRRF